MLRDISHQYFLLFYNFISELNTRAFLVWNAFLVPESQATFDSFGGVPPGALVRLGLSHVKIPLPNQPSPLGNCESVSRLEPHNNAPDYLK